MAILTASIWSYRKEKGHPIKQKESEQLIGAGITIQLIVFIFTILNVVYHPIIDYALNNGIAGAAASIPLIIFSIFLSEKIITVKRVLKFFRIAE